MTRVALPWTSPTSRSSCASANLRIGFTTQRRLRVPRTATFACARGRPRRCELLPALLARRARVFFAGALAEVAAPFEAALACAEAPLFARIAPFAGVALFPRAALLAEPALFAGPALPAQVALFAGAALFAPRFTLVFAWREDDGLSPPLAAAASSSAS